MVEKNECAPPIFRATMVIALRLTRLRLNVIAAERRRRSTTIDLQRRVLQGVSRLVSLLCLLITLSYVDGF